MGIVAIGCRKVDICIGQSSFLNHRTRVDYKSGVTGSRNALAIHDQSVGVGGDDGRSIYVRGRVVVEKFVRALDVT